MFVVQREIISQVSQRQLRRQGCKQRKNTISYHIARCIWDRGALHQHNTCAVVLYSNKRFSVGGVSKMGQWVWISNVYDIYYVHHTFMTNPHILLPCAPKSCLCSAFKSTYSAGCFDLAPPSLEAVEKIVCTFSDCVWGAFDLMAALDLVDTVYIQKWSDTCTTYVVCNYIADTQ